MKKLPVIAIGREFCSGGAEIGHRLAAHYDIPYYDRSIIDHTAEVTKLSEQIVESHDEKALGFFDFPGMPNDNSWYLEDPSAILPIGLRIADAQFDIIKKTAQNGPGVFVGRCSDYVLRDRPDVLRIFIYADMQAKIQRAQRLYGLNEKTAKRLINKTNRARANYYNKYTHEKWGDRNNFELFINAGAIGTDKAVQMICYYIDNLYEPK